MATKSYFKIDKKVLYCLWLKDIGASSSYFSISNGLYILSAKIKYNFIKKSTKNNVLDVNRNR